MYEYRIQAFPGDISEYDYGDGDKDKLDALIADLGLYNYVISRRLVGDDDDGWEFVESCCGFIGISDAREDAIAQIPEGVYFEFEEVF